MTNWRCVCAFAVALNVSCSSPPVSSPDAGLDATTATPDTSFDAPPEEPEVEAESFPAFPPDLPQVRNAGGPIITSPKVIPIFFAGEDVGKVTSTVDFLGKLVGSSYWTATTSEYGVGPLALLPTVNLTETAPTTTDYDTVALWIDASIASGAMPPPSAGAIYTIYFPPTTSIQAFGLTSCLEFGGYHSSTPKGAVYAVVAGCATYNDRLAPGESLSGIDFITGLTTHELIEAATDPIITKRAWSSIDPAHIAWARYLFAGELADTCELQPNAFFKESTIGYVVQRSWSNSAALVGHEPCPPTTATPYFAAVPKLDKHVTTVAITKAVAINLGAKATIEVDLWSDGPTSGPWTVKAFDFATERGKPPMLALSLDKSSGKNGDILALTIEVLAVDPSYTEGFILESELGGKKTRVAGMVYQP